ncbi:universal stress protein [Aporhodopirellula aestuarii]|uniref:Universal stress protein n=1 Tax=Aporhodopirellula aestuarii TaxID=2950107 RepID=A0ABT0U0M5_9BACT|nr:universal stress protein [Aporhodopirellula aestuarii]MCM2370194.1 universal stress protein [Aporhodopirellula aestuarii]
MNHFENTQILVPFDFSEDAQSAVETATGIAEKNDNVTVLHVIDPGQLYGFDDNGGYELGGGLGTVTHESARLAQINEKHQHAALEAMQELFADSAYQGIHLVTTVDVPAEGITKYASTNAIELIVIPSHGQSGFRPSIIGSVAEKVVRLAHCPVLVLRG